MWQLGEVWSAAGIFDKSTAMTTVYLSNSLQFQEQTNEWCKVTIHSRLIWTFINSQTQTELLSHLRPQIWCWSQMSHGSLHHVFPTHFQSLKKNTARWDEQAWWTGLTGNTVFQDTTCLVNSYYKHSLDRFSASLSCWPGSPCIQVLPHPKD